MHPANVRVTIYGTVNVEHALLIADGNGVAAILIGLEQKWASIGATGGNGGVPCICVHADKDDDDLTEIRFPDYAGWRVHCSEINKYTLYVCLVRSSMYDPPAPEE